MISTGFVGFSLLYQNALSMLMLLGPYSGSVFFLNISSCLMRKFKIILVCSCKLGTDTLESNLDRKYFFYSHFWRIVLANLHIFSNLLRGALSIFSSRKGPLICQWKLFQNLTAQMMIFQFNNDHLSSHAYVVSSILI